jgi:hypothetical protein
MKNVETDVIVTQDVVNERPAPPVSRVERSLADLPVHDLGPWPEKLSLRRANLYGEDER